MACDPAPAAWLSRHRSPGRVTRASRRGFRSHRRRLVLPLLTVLTVAEAGCGGSSAPVGAGAAAHGAARSASAAVTSPVLTACPTGASETRVPLPSVRLTCFTGGAALSLASLPARPYVVNLWASWCSPCQREAPRFAAAAARYRGQVAFLGVDTQDQRSAALVFLGRFGLGYPQLSDPDGAVLHRLGAAGLPVTLAVDAAGQVVYRRLGEVSSAQLRAALYAADPGLRLPAGRAGG